MAINAQNNGTSRTPIPADNYIARCYSMIHIGTNEEDFQGEKKMVNKVRIGWEIPAITGADGKPATIGKDFTLSMNEKANLRKTLASWRGKDFTEDEAKNFDVTKLLGAPCMLNVIMKTAATGGRTYENISSVTPIPKGVPVPDAILPRLVFEHDNPDYTLLEALPDFIKDKVKTSNEYRTANSIPGGVGAQQSQPAAVQQQQPAPAGVQQPAAAPVQQAAPQQQQAFTPVTPDPDLPF